MDLDRTGIDDDLSKVLDGLSKAYNGLADAVDRAEGFLLGKKLQNLIDEVDEMTSRVKKTRRLLMEG